MAAISQSDYDYFKAHPDQYTVNPDGSVSWAGSNGLTNNRAADGTNYVTDSGGNRVDPNKVQDLNNANDNLAGGVLPGIGSNPVTGVIDATLAIPKAAKNQITGDDGSAAAADKTAISTAAHNLGAWDPNAPNTQDFGNQQGVATPVVNAPTISAPGAVAPPSVDFNAGLIKAAPQITGAPSAGVAPVVSAPQLGPGAQATAGSAGAGSIRGTTPLVDVQSAAPVSDITVGGAGRDAQMTALGQLKDAAEGKTPSAAEWLLRKGIDENVGAAYGLAASLQGRNPGVALRTGTMTAKDAIAKSAADMAALRATEQAKAREAYATLGTSIAAQDLSALQSNQSKDLTLSVTNLQEKIKVLQGNQQTQLEEGKADLAAQTAASIATLQAQTSVAVANPQASTSRDIANQTAQLDASKANAANAVALQIADANNQMQVLVSNLQAQTAANDRNAATQTAAAIAQLDAQTKLLMQQQDQIYDAAKQNAANQVSINNTNATNATNVSISNAALEERKQSDMAAADAKLKELGLQSLIAQLNASISVAKTDQERQAAEDQFWASLAGTAGKVIAA